MKVGDRVRVLKVDNTTCFDNYIGRAGVLRDIDNIRLLKFLVMFENDCTLWCTEVEKIYPDYELPLELFTI